MHFCPGDLVRTRVQEHTSSEYFAGERVSVNLFPAQKISPSHGRFEPHQIGIIIYVDDRDMEVKIFISENGLTGWVNWRFLEVIA